jgi:hypothetical protein
MYGFCWHRWTITDKTEQPSRVEIATDAGLLINSRGHAAMASCVRPVIVVYRCSKCGAQKVERV